VNEGPFHNLVRVICSIFVLLETSLFKPLPPIVESPKVQEGCVPYRGLFALDNLCSDLSGCAIDCEFIVKQITNQQCRLKEVSLNRNTHKTRLGNR
jgi:hypothetical protein